MVQENRSTFGKGKQMQLNILYEDTQIIVCEKKPGVPVQSDKTMDFDLVNQLKNYCYEKDNRKPPYIGLVHRLDRPVGGVMVFAKTPFAAKELSRQIQENLVEKHYLCVVTKDLSTEQGMEKKKLTDYLKKDARQNVSVIVPKSDKNGKKAELFYKVLQVKEECSLIEVELITGRHHQIRVQMSAHVAGLWGDTKYNPNQAKETGWKEIALFSHRLSFCHPKTKKKMTFSLKPEGEIWGRFSEIDF